MLEKVSERCVLLKSLPADVKACDIKTILDTGSGETAYVGKYEDIHQHIDDKDVRWIVLFKFKEDADACIENGSWTTDTRFGPVQVVPARCLDCIIPDKWTRAMPEEKQSILLDDWVVTGILEGGPYTQTKEITQDEDDASYSIKSEGNYPSEEPSEDVKEHDAVNKYNKRSSKTTGGNEISGSSIFKHNYEENISLNIEEDIENTDISTAGAQNQQIETIDLKQHDTTGRSKLDNTSEEKTTKQNNKVLKNMATSPSYVTPELTAPVSQPVHMMPSTLPINQQDIPYDYTSGMPSVAMPHVFDVFDVQQGAPYMYGGQQNHWLTQMAYPQANVQGASERLSVMFVPVRVPVPFQVNNVGQYFPIPVHASTPYMPNLMYDQQGITPMPMTGDSEHTRVAINLQSGANRTNGFEKEDNDDGPYYTMDKDKPFHRPPLDTQESTASIDRFGYFKPDAIICDEIDTPNMESSIQLNEEKEKDDILKSGGTKYVTRPLPSVPNKRQPTEINKPTDVETTSKLIEVIKEPLKVNPGKLRYIMQFKRHQLEDIEKQFSPSVRIDRIDTDKILGFQLSGKKDDVRLAISKLQTVVDTGVLTKEHILDTPDIQTFIETEDGLHQCQKIEAKTTCVLLIDRSFITEKEHRKRYEESASSLEITVCHIGNCDVIALLADLTSMKIDAIVMPTTPSMTNYSIGLGAAIIKKGGPEIQRECDTIRQERSVLNIGEVLFTKAGKLSCKAIFHAVVSTRTGDDSNDKKNLQKSVSKCLEEAHKRRYESLAIPVLGVGRFQYPATQATEYIAEAVNTFLKKHGDSTFLRKIFICAKMVENVKELSNSMVKIFGEDISQVVPYSDAIEDDLLAGMSRRAVSQEACPVKVEVVLGSLENQNVDVIVNSTNQNINMNVGKVSKQLLKAGGDQLLKECQQKCPKKGLKVCDIIATSGGAMNCLAIFHGIINQWKNKESENVLELFVQNCLQKADKERFTSIAFPALGTGVLGFPAQVAARIMFDCVSTFSGLYMRKVLFVVWSGSPETVKAFQDEERKHGQTKTKLAARKSNKEEIISQPTNQPFTKTIEGLTIEVEQGDITKEKTDLIVNSTLKELDLDSGAVSKAILIAAGDTVQAECKGTQQRMINDGFVYTSAGRLFSKGIIHVKAKNNEADWEKVVLMVMEYADTKGFNSVSFPALGTGGKGGDPAIVAMVMFKAFMSYNKLLSISHCVKKVRIVIYQHDMLNIFKNAMDDSIRRSSTSRSSILPNWFSPKKKEDEAVKCGVVFNIYSDSEHNLNMAQNDLDSLYQEDSLSLETYAKQGLTQAQVRKLKSICDGRHVTLNIDDKKGEIILQGYGNSVSDVKWEIREFFKKQ